MAGRIGLAVFGLGNMASCMLKTNEPTRLGVFAKSVYGAIHIKNIMTSPRASLKWVVRNKIEEAEKFVKVYDIPARFTTPDHLDPLLQDPAVHGVIVCSPSNSHQQIITAAITAGKAVLCEKPLTTDVDSTLKCYRLADTQGCHLICAFHRRFDPSFRSVYERLRAGSLGPLRLLRTSSRDHTPPSADYLKTSGGIFFDTVIHDLDIASWMAGSRPKEVFSQGHAFSRQFVDCDDVDLQVTTVRFDNGVMGILDNLRQSLYGYDQRLEAVCEKGVLTVDNRAVDLVTEHGPLVTAGPRIGRSYLTRYPEAYANELDHFLDVLEGKSVPLITKADTVQAMRLAEACKQSYKSGQPVTV